MAGTLARKASTAAPAGSRALEGVAPSWGARLRGVEGLRALAATSVLIHHTVTHADVRSGLGTFGKWAVPNLASGLTLFFTLSGFLLYRPFASAVMHSRPMPSTRAYLRNRALRILPAYWLIVLLVAAVKPIHSPRVVIQNMLLAQNYSPSTVGTGIAPAWSLDVELVFYLALPLLGLWALSLARDRDWRGRTLAVLVPAGALMALGIAGKALAAATLGSGGQAELAGNSWHAVLERSFLAQADLFAFGMAAAVVVIAADAGRVQGPDRLGAACGWAAVLLGSVAGVLYAFAGLNERPYNTITAIASGLIVLWLLLPQRKRSSPAVGILNSRVAIRVGVISYSVYLWHDPIIRWLNNHGHLEAGVSGVAVNVAVVAAITAIASTVTYMFVEAPAMRRKVSMVPVRIDPDTAPETAAMEAAP